MAVVGLVADIHGDLAGLRRALAIFAREGVSPMYGAAEAVLGEALAGRRSGRSSPRAHGRERHGGQVALVRPRGAKSRRPPRRRPIIVSAR